MNVFPFRLAVFPFSKAVLSSVVLEFPNGRLFLCCPLYPCLYSTRSSEPWLNSTFGLPTLPLYHAWTCRTSVYFSYNLPSFTPSLSNLFVVNDHAQCSVSSAHNTVIEHPRFQSVYFRIEMSSWLENNIFPMVFNKSKFKLIWFNSWLLVCVLVGTGQNIHQTLYISILARQVAGTGLGNIILKELLWKVVVLKIFLFLRSFIVKYWF